MEQKRSLFQKTVFGETDVLNSINLAEPWKLVELFNTIDRTSSTPGEWKAAAYIEERLKAHNIPFTRYEPELYLSIPKSAELHLAGKKLPAKTPSFSVSTKPGGVSGELRYISADQISSSGKQLREFADGRIIITEWPPAAEVIVSKLADLGARAVVFVHPGQRIHEDTCSSIWGSPDMKTAQYLPHISVINVGQSTGQELFAALANGDNPKVTVYTVLDTGWKKTPLVVAEIPGTVWPEEFVLLGGHLDSWHVGIGDNGTGDGAMLEIARVLWEHQTKLKRTVRIAWWPGHSTGRYAGSTWFADNFALDLIENCVTYLNCDSPGCRWATSFRDMPWMAELGEFTKQVILDVTGEAASGKRPSRAGDYSFNNLGISGTLMLSSHIPATEKERRGLYGVGGCGGNIEWHTEDDTLDVADKDYLLRDIKIYALAVWRLANSEVHPADYGATVREMARFITEHQRDIPADLDLKELVHRAGSLSDKLSAFYKNLEHKVENLSPEQIRNLNNLQRKLARELVEVNYSSSGRFQQDPAQPLPPVPDLAAVKELSCVEPDSDSYGFLLTSLTRGRNRLLYRLKRAEELLDGLMQIIE